MIRQREKLFDHFQRLSPEFYNRNKTGDLIAYAINDISAVRMTFGPATAMSINGLAICSISIYSMCSTINLRITLILNPILSIERIINIFERGMPSLKRLNNIFKVRELPLQYILKQQICKDSS